MSKFSIRVFVVVLWPALALLPVASRAAENAAPRFADEMAKQENIYQSRGEQRPEGYVVDRSLLS